MCDILKIYFLWTLVITLSYALNLTINTDYENEFDYEDFGINANEIPQNVTQNVINTDKKEVKIDSNEIPDEVVTEKMQISQTNGENDVEKEMVTQTIPSKRITPIPMSSRTPNSRLNPMINRKHKKSIKTIKPNLWNKIWANTRNEQRSKFNYSRNRYYWPKYFPSNSYLISHYYYYPLHRNQYLLYIPIHDFHVPQYSNHYIINQYITPFENRRLFSHYRKGTPFSYNFNINHNIIGHQYSNHYSKNLNKW